ncbi:DUF2887 domain-containing protein [Gloeocapsa sp. BRSZ]
MRCSMLNGGQLYRVYLDELGDIRTLSPNVVLMVLTTVEKAQAPQEARYLLNRTCQEQPQPTTQAIIEMITTIIAYKFVRAACA